MTNIFNYKFKDLIKALEATDKLETKLENKDNYNIELQKSDYGYWNVKLSITNENTTTNKTRSFSTTV